MPAASLHTFYLIRNSFVLGKKGGGGGGGGGGDSQIEEAPEIFSKMLQIHYLHRIKKKYIYLKKLINKNY